MDQHWAAYAAALALGATHALEVDHMVAVTAFVGNDPRLRSAVSFGIRWGLGHAAAVIVAGLVLIALGVAIPASAEPWTELAVGLALILVGLWAVRASRRLHLHDPARHGGHAHLHTHPVPTLEHVHPHATDSSHRHRHLSTIVGAVHGLAGTAPVVALVPVTLMNDTAAAVGYLVAFGLGTTVSMGAYAGLAALAVARAGSTMRLARRIALATAFASIGVGCWWMLRSAARLTD